jgi:hypothetical protein
VGEKKTLGKWSFKLIRRRWKDNILTSGLKARIVQPEETAVVRQWHGKHLSLKVGFHISSVDFWAQLPGLMR